jgi:uncharacterized protein (DUF1800 family)
MKHTRWALFTLAAGVAAMASGLAAVGSPAGAPDGKAADQAVVHLLHRLGYGPRPGDIEKVRRMGLEAYIEQQLHPDRISDVNAEERLSGLSTLSMGSRELAERYELPALAAQRERRQAAAKNPDGALSQPPPVPGLMRQQANLPLMELSQQKVLRAIYSERQLQEVLTDFWFNHFNVDARKGPVRIMAPEYERDAIRPYVLGRFRDLLGATAKSPAMLFYLDNWMSADPDGPGIDARQPLAGRGAIGGFGRGRLQRPPIGQRPSQQGQLRNAPRGLNENYGRELLELHTLGVDGGYTQRDVTEVARAFTGWTIDRPRLGGGFRFEPRMHDNGEKLVLGHRIKSGGGIRDGEQVLDILSAHPSTARFISTKLARRFVSDAPPQALVDRMAARFAATGGNLGDVMKLLLTSPEFLSPDAYRAKVKTPFEFVVSSLRATGLDLTDARPLVRAVQQLGMPLYQCQPPTGYKDTADAWVNAGALVNRMNVALTLAGGELAFTGPGGAGRAGDGRLVRIGRPSGIDSTRLIDEALGGSLSDVTRTTIARAGTPEQAIALTLGSPEFQRR